MQDYSYFGARAFSWRSPSGGKRSWPTPKIIRAGQPLFSSGLAPLIGAMGLPAPGFLAVCAVLNESLGALFIASGLLARLSSAVGAVGMAVAFCVSLRLDEEPLRAALYFIIFAGLAITGPGRFSIDRLLSRRKFRRLARQFDDIR